MFDRLFEVCRKKDLQSVMFTFPNSPRQLLSGKGDSAILTNEEREEKMRERGLDIMVECPFTEALRNMSPEAFFEKVLVEWLHASHLVVGKDFHFGKNRAGDVAFLKRISPVFGVEVDVIDKLKEGDADVSSTRIRRALDRGDMELAERLLGYPYYLSGEIIHGAELGRTIGFPTINQACREYKFLPPYGVYFSKTYINDRTYESITNLGCKPTVNGNGVGAETHLFDASGDFYGKEARVELLHFHRPEQKFSSLDALKIQLEQDIFAARSRIYG